MPWFLRPRPLQIALAARATSSLQERDKLPRRVAELSAEGRELLEKVGELNGDAARVPEKCLDEVGEHLAEAENRLSNVEYALDQLPRIDAEKTWVKTAKVKQAIEAGEYEGQADTARQLGLTRARVSQLLDLTRLAPGIQEGILFMERVDGVEPMSERRLRGVVSPTEWTGQLRLRQRTQ